MTADRCYISEAVRTASACPPIISGIGIREYLMWHIPWSSETFGPGRRTAGVVEHMRRELVEIEAAAADENWPEVGEELTDVVILALDGAWRSAHFSTGVDRPIIREVVRLSDSIADLMIEALLDVLDPDRLPDLIDIRAQLDTIADTGMTGETLTWCFIDIAAVAARQLRLASGMMHNSNAGWTAVKMQLFAKLERNRARKWPDWRGVPEGVPIEHIRSVERAP